MSTLSTILALSKPADDDPSWGTEFRNMVDTLDRLSALQGAWYVSPAFTDANLYPYGAPSGRRHFDTIAGALGKIDGTDSHDTIFIGPGDYPENLSISGRVNLVGLKPASSSVFGTPVRIIGNTASPVIDWTPRSSFQDTLSIANVRLGQDGTDPGSNQTWPYVLRVNDQGAGNYGGGRNVLQLDHVSVYEGATAGGRTWDSAFEIKGYNRVSMLECNLYLDGDMTSGLIIEGNNAAGVVAELLAKRVTFTHTGGANQTFLLDEGVNGFVYDCSFSRPFNAIATEGGTGVQNVTGLNNQTEFDNLKNVESLFLNH